MSVHHGVCQRTDSQQKGLQGQAFARLPHRFHPNETSCTAKPRAAQGTFCFTLAWSVQSYPREERKPQITLLSLPYCAACSSSHLWGARKPVCDPSLRIPE